SGAPDRFDGIDRCGDTGLLIARSPTIDPPVAEVTAERVDRPSGAGWHDVVVAIEMENRVVAVDHTDDVDAWKLHRMFGETLRRQYFHGVAKLVQFASD